MSLPKVVHPFVAVGEGEMAIGERTGKGSVLLQPLGLWFDVVSIEMGVEVGGRIETVLVAPSALASRVRLQVAGLDPPNASL